MKYSTFFIAFSALAFAAPPVISQGTETTLTSFESSTVRTHHSHHQHHTSSTKVRVQYVRVTVYVDQQGNTIYKSPPTPIPHPNSDLETKTDTASGEGSSEMDVDSNDGNSDVPSTPVPTDVPTQAPEPIVPTDQPSLDPHFDFYNPQPLIRLMHQVPPSIPFRNGEHDCENIPIYEGVVPLHHVGFNGWTTVYDPSTGEVKGPCREGTYCSYACQSGMLKTQWPENQPENGVSVGGLFCQNGKLHLTNPRSEFLCEWGLNTASLDSEVSELISVCQTDYPGSENMVIPTLLLPHSKGVPLAVNNQETYYHWKGMMTSLQYYVNNAGVGIQEGCRWGEPGSTVGNYAPINIGAGYYNGITYLSIFPNPNNQHPANFNVRILGRDESSLLLGDCFYENGIFSGTPSGCTASVSTGGGTFLFYR